MEYTPITAFQRAIDAGQLAGHPPAPAEVAPVNKWEALRTLGLIRTQLGLSDRALTVLQALLSFHPQDDLDITGALVVYPSNATLCARLNGMPCSTMRRHLAALVKAGLLTRRDSPNGKRYRQRGAAQGFGFDLSPLAAHHKEHLAEAQAVIAEEAARDRLRTSLSLMKRDLAALVAYGQQTQPERSWDAWSDLAQLTGRSLRRKLSRAEMEAIRPALEAALNEVKTALDVSDKTDEVSSNDAQNEQHHLNSKKERFESNETQQSIPLNVVLAACPGFQEFCTDPIRNWNDLLRTVHRLYPMLGISPSMWQTAIGTMGQETAAMTLVAMIEKAHEITNPGGYLRALCRKAEMGQFSAVPMVLANLRRHDHAAKFTTVNTPTF